MANRLELWQYRKYQKSGTHHARYICHTNKNTKKYQNRLDTLSSKDHTPPLAATSGQHTLATSKRKGKKMELSIGQLVMVSTIGPNCTVRIAKVIDIREPQKMLGMSMSNKSVKVATRNKDNTFNRPYWAHSGNVKPIQKNTEQRKTWQEPPQ